MRISYTTPLAVLESSMHLKSTEAEYFFTSRWVKDPSVFHQQEGEKTVVIGRGKSISAN